MEHHGGEGMKSMEARRTWSRAEVQAWGRPTLGLLDPARRFPTTILGNDPKPPARVLKRAGPGSPFVDALVYDKKMPSSRKERKQKRSKHKAEMASRRQLVYARDGHRCVKCGARGNLTLDHALPRSKGGTNEMDNLQTMCSPCNNAKGDESWKVSRAA